MHTKKHKRGSWIIFLILIMLFVLPYTTFSQMVRVEAGSVSMKPTSVEIPFSDEGTFSISYDYWIGKYEVTFSDWLVYSRSTGAKVPDDLRMGKGMRPVIHVSWYDAVAYCNWESLQYGLKAAYDEHGRLLDTAGNLTDDLSRVEGFRLPSEEEWLYAALGGHKAWDLFPFAGSNKADEVAWYSDNADQQSQPVGYKSPNVLGIYDLSGNVYEWMGSAESTETAVARGGSWASSVNEVRIDHRIEISRKEKSPHIGFRLARTAWPETAMVPRPIPAGQQETPEPSEERAVVFNATGYGRNPGPVSQVISHFNRYAHDPESVEYVEWGRVIRTSTGYEVWVAVRARNSAGALVLNNYDFTFDHNGDIIRADRRD